MKIDTEAAGAETVNPEKAGYEPAPVKWLQRFGGTELPHANHHFMLNNKSQRFNFMLLFVLC